MARPPQPDLKIKPLNRQQKLAMQLMLDGFGKGQVCEKLNICQATLWRWMQQPAWATTLEHAVRGEQKEGELQMRTLVPLATKVVNTLLVSGADNIKLGASRLVFETVANLVAREEQHQVLSELEERLEELQALARNQGAMAQPMLSSSCAPVISAGTQEVAAASVDVDLEPSNPVEEGQIGLFGPGAGQDRAINTPITPHTHEGGEG